MKKTLALLTVIFLAGLIANLQIADAQPFLGGPPPAKCNGTPVLKNLTVTPETTWAPANKTLKINITGTVEVAPGCGVSGNYSMDSNAGTMAGDFDITSEGDFAIAIPVNVSKEGKEKGGTNYNGELTVVDMLGSKTSQTFSVSVAHDRSK